MTDQLDTGSQQSSMSYSSRLRTMLKLWKDARRAAHYDDSIFIWIPKNAGTSLYEILHKHGFVKLKSPGAARYLFRNAGRVTFGHVDVGALVESGTVTPDFVDNAFKFAVTRDPYERAASLYRYLSERVMSNWHKRPDFRAFLRLLADGHYDRIGLYNSRGLSQCNPQVEWLRRYWPDKLYKVEELDEFVADISDRWGISKAQVPHKNPSTGNAHIELTREEQALIEQVYAEDFESLGYSKRRTAVFLARS